MSSINITQGSQSAIATDLVGTVNYQVVKFDIGTAGASSPFDGYFRPSSTILTASALGTAGGSQFGTLSAASGAGTKHYVTGLQVVMSDGTADIYLGFGTALTGGSVLARGKFTPGGGIARDFTYPMASGTNSEICYEFAGAGTAYIAVNYWKG